MFDFLFMSIVAKKLNMSQIFLNEKVIPVTFISVQNKEDLDKFQEGEMVKISGVSKGKGFQGVVKRHKFAGASKTHGTKHALREPGSIGATWPQRVIKGKRMAGRMGGERITIKNLKIIKIDKEKSHLLVKGALPGNRGTVLEIQIPNSKIQMTNL